MADTNFILGFSDTLDPLILNLFQNNGQYELVDPADTVTLYMMLATDHSIRQTHVMTLTDTPTAEYTYAWVGDDTIQPGMWLANVQRVRAADGRKKTYPNDSMFSIQITNTVLNTA